MYEERQELFDKAQTAATIKKLVNTYSGDLRVCFLDSVSLSSLTLPEFFDYVRKIPYRQDKKPIEVVSRPYYIVKWSLLGMDCKKKALMISAWCKENNVPYRFIGSSKRPDKKVHHIFVQGMIKDQWTNLDATYPEYRIGQKKDVTYFEIL